MVSFSCRRWGSMAPCTVSICLLASSHNCQQGEKGAGGLPWRLGRSAHAVGPDRLLVRLIDMSQFDRGRQQRLVERAC
eukprot:757067-Hanusia_phi.AAC.3